MKGIVFTEFLELVEDAWSLDMVDTILADAKTATGGAYTAVGTYDGAEMVALIGALSRATGTPMGALIETFGRHLFGRFVALYPAFFEGCESTFDFLPRVDEYIHVEVRKLYHDAELPSIQARQDGPDTMHVVYRSPRCMAKLARGLIDGCIAHFGDRCSVAEADDTGGGSQVTFTLQRLPA